MNAFSVPATNVIVVGALAGGISAVRSLLSKFPENVPAAIFVVVHTSPDGPGMLASVLNRGTPLTVVTPEDGMVARKGHVYVAPPDYHLIIDGRHVHLTHGPREHRFRPVVDPLFRTAAEHYGAPAIGVVLSGHMADGTHGLTLIKEAGAWRWFRIPMRRKPRRCRSMRCVAALRRLLLDPREHASTRSRRLRRRQSHG